MHCAFIYAKIMNIQRERGRERERLDVCVCHKYIYNTYTYIYTYAYTCVYNIYICIAPVKILYVSSCYCYGYRFWGGLSLSRVLWKSACSRSNMKPKSIPKQARKWIEELFCWFQVLRQHFMFLSFCIHSHPFSFMFLSFACIFLSFCIHFLSFSFHYPFYSFHLYCIHVPSFSVHIPFIFLSNVHSCPFIFLSFACRFLSFCIRPFNKWLSLRLLLNNPSNI